MQRDERRGWWRERRVERKRGGRFDRKQKVERRVKLERTGMRSKEGGKEGVDGGEIVRGKERENVTRYEDSRRERSCMLEGHTIT